MRLYTLSVVSLTILLNGCPPIESITMINTTKTDLTLKIQHGCTDDSRSATQVIEVPAHASRPGPMVWNTSVSAISLGGSVLFHQDNVWPDVLAREYVGEEKVWFSTRCKYLMAIEEDGIYFVPVKYWDSVYGHLDEIRNKP